MLPDDFILQVLSGFVVLVSFSLCAKSSTPQAFRASKSGFLFLNSANVTEYFSQVRHCSGCWEYGVVNETNAMAAHVVLVRTLQRNRTHG